MKTAVKYIVFFFLLFGSGGYALRASEFDWVVYSPATSPELVPVPERSVPAGAPQWSGLQERLVSAGFSAEQAKRIIQYSNEPALAALAAAGEEGLTPVGVYRGIFASKIDYDPRYKSSYGKVGEKYYYRLWTARNLDACVEFSRQNLVLKMSIPGLFLLYPCTEWACVFDRSLAADDRAFILEVATFSGSKPVWVGYDLFFDARGNVKF